MDVRDDGNVLLVRLAPGDEVMASLKAACERHGVQGGMIFGIGALNRAEILTGARTDRLDPGLEEIRGPIEIGAATGNVSLKEGEVYLHLHVCLGLMKDKARGGAGPEKSYNTHLVEGTVSLTGSFFIYKTDPIRRKFEEPQGMWVWDL